MKYIVLILVALFCINSCTNPEAENRHFEKLANNYVQYLLKSNPLWATYLGDHRYDSEIGDYSEAGIQADIAVQKAYLDSLAKLDSKKMSAVNAIDYQILVANIESQVFSAEVLKEHVWNPRFYNVGNFVYPLIARDFAPLKDRLTSMMGRLEKIPGFLETAKTNLKNPPKIHTETMISQNKGAIGMIRGQVDELLKEVPELKEQFAPVQEEAIAAIEDFGTWMEKELLPASKGDFRLGSEMYDRKLKHTLESDLTKEEILAKAEQDLEDTKAAMVETARPLFEKWFPKLKPDGESKIIKAVLDRLAEDRPDNDNIVALAEKHTQECIDFCKEKDLITVPDEKVKIIVMPEFQRGVAVAYCDAPGPLEEKGETFYAISPTPKNWNKSRVTSFFKEYNNYMVKNLTVHEAVPGHYLQLAHSNKFMAPTKIRAIFYSGVFVEGWATYAEQTMVENGFGGPQVKMQQLKMRLRLIINSIIDQKIHTAGMTEKEAMDLMMKAGFQEEGEASGKWRRACLTSTQLSTYYVGNLEMNRIRDAYKAQMGDKYTLKGFHDKMMSFGSPAPRYLNQLMGVK